jgi:hypothetical protein
MSWFLVELVHSDLWHAVLLIWFAGFVPLLIIALMFDLPGLGSILPLGYFVAEFQYDYVGMVYPLSRTELQNKINMGADL